MIRIVYTGEFGLVRRGDVPLRTGQEIEVTDEDAVALCERPYFELVSEPIAIETEEPEEAE